VRNIITNTWVTGNDVKEEAESEEGEEAEGEGEGEDDDDDEVRCENMHGAVGEESMYM
jgi:hypothetical protein